MDTRLTVQSEFRTKSTSTPRTGNLRRKAWLAVFSFSALFWVVVALSLWHFWG